jgi:hypothetical protein
MFVSSWPLSQQRGLSCLDLSIQQQQNPDSPIAIRLLSESDYVG